MEWSKVILYLGQFILTLGFFIGLVLIFAKYHEGPTNIEFEVETFPSLMLPAMTFCSHRAFKTRGFHFNERDFIAQTFKLQDIFDPATVIQLLHNKTKFSLTPVRSELFGQCFTVQNLM